MTTYTQTEMTTHKQKEMTDFKETFNQSTYGLNHQNDRIEMKQAELSGHSFCQSKTDSKVMQKDFTFQHTLLNANKTKPKPFLI